MLLKLNQERDYGELFYTFDRKVESFDFIRKNQMKLGEDGKPTQVNASMNSPELLAKGVYLLDEKEVLYTVNFINESVVGFNQYLLKEVGNPGNFTLSQQNVLLLDGFEGALLLEEGNEGGPLLLE